uniref:Putative conserved secreted protein n=1 Tax=Amblyomma triste TaxID=251400 RepID=A0A023GAN6_AMBTT
MRLTPFLVLLLLALWSGSYTVASVESSQPESDVWITSGIVSDLSLPDTLRGELEVKYGDLSVVKNGTLTPAQTAEAPTMVKLRGAINCIPPFALVMLDPDVPSRENPTERSKLHWMVLNVNSTRKLHEGDVAVPYRGPNPTSGSGPHRYVFLAYCQGAQRVLTSEIAPQQRSNFDLADFFKKLRAGNPFGGNFFYAENA